MPIVDTDNLKNGVINIPPFPGEPVDPHGGSQQQAATQQAAQQATAQQATQRAQQAQPPQQRTAARPQAELLPPPPQQQVQEPQGGDEETADIEGVLNQCGLAVAEAYDQAGPAIQDGLILVLSLDQNGYHGTIQKGERDLQTWNAGHDGLGALLEAMVIYLQEYQPPQPKKPVTSRFGHIRRG